MLQLINAISLFNSATTISKGEDKHVALGLAEIALEELGKAYTCLAYYSSATKLDNWSEFWKVWRSHKIKAYRAFFFEFFCLMRIEIPEFDEKFPTKHEIIPHEKRN